MNLRIELELVLTNDGHAANGFAATISWRESDKRSHREHEQQEEASCARLAR